MTHDACFYLRPSIKLVTAGVLATLLAAPAAFAQHEGHGGGDKGGEGKKESEGKKGGGHDMMGGMQGMHGAAEGAEVQMCHGKSDMPPHFCEPSYKVGSSLRGVRVDSVAPAGDRVLQVTLRELNVTHPGVTQKLVVFAGAGDLAGATIVEGGWKEARTLTIPLIGSDTIYDHKSVHVHAMPLTGN